jgi:fructose-1,6-bisphosphatase I
MLRATGRSAVLVSEEDEQAIIISDCERGHYCLAFDPLDGSSNIDCGVSIGTIFGIWHQTDVTRPGCVSDILRSGKEMVGAGYCMYGSSSVFVLALGGEVNGYTLDPNIGEFLLTHPKITIGTKRIYSINEGNAQGFDKGMCELVTRV